MVWVLVLAVGLWILGARLKASVRARWGVLLGLYALVLLALAVLPQAHPLRGVLGGSLGEYLVLGGLVAVVLGYRRGLGWLRARARPAEVEAVKPGVFQPGEVERFARHIMLREIGGLGQKRLKQAKVLVVGAGGLGSPALLYLSAAGVGSIGVIDDDVVEASNMQRQIIHAEDRLGMAKVFSAEIAMKGVNPYVQVKPYQRRLTDDIAAELIAGYDIVLDGTDNFETRYLCGTGQTAGVRRPDPVGGADQRVRSGK